MPIKRYLRHTSFGPDDIAIIVAAFAGACKALGLVDRADPMTQMVAKEVVRAAEHGMGTPAQLQRRAMLMFHSPGRSAKSSTQSHSRSR